MITKSIKHLRTILPIMAFLVVFVAIFSSSVASAASPVFGFVNTLELEGCKGSYICTPNEKNSVMNVIGQVITVLIWASAIVSTIVIIVSGIMYALASGDPGKISKAKDALLYSVIGLVVSLLAFAIVYFVTNVMK